MAVNYSGEGNVITYSNSGSAISSGDVVVIGSLIGAALVDIAATTGSGSVQISGVFDLPKVDAAVIAVGEVLSYDVSTSDFDDNAAVAAAGDITGSCVAMEALGATTSANILVKINVGEGIVT